MGFVVQGLLEVVKRNEIGDNVVIARLTKGNSIGEMALIDKSPRSATVIARQPTTMVTLTDKGFDILTEKSPLLGVKVIRKSRPSAESLYAPNLQQAGRPDAESMMIDKEAKAFHGMIGACPAMQKLFHLIERVAEDDESTVLIHGESGTGKEMVAKAIHLQSARREKNFVPVNCAAIPDDLLESELFRLCQGGFYGCNRK